jgi:GMP synthase-like glutamine amidotransferase
VRVLAIVHQRDAGPGVFAEAISDAGGELDEWTPAERPQPPADPFGYDAVLVLGGAMNADEGDRHGWIAEEKALLGELPYAPRPGSSRGRAVPDECGPPPAISLPAPT